MSGRVQVERAHKRADRPESPSQEWSGGAQTRAEAYTPTPHAGGRSGGVQAERAHKHKHTPALQRAVVWRSKYLSATTITHTARPSQQWRGTSGARTQTHTHPGTKARSGGAQPKPELEHTNPRRTAQPAVAGYMRSAHTNTHTPKRSGQEWRGAAKARKPEPGVAGYRRSAHTNTRTPQNPSQEWRAGAGARTQTHTHPTTAARRAQSKPEPKHTQPHRTPQPGVAGYKRSAHTNAHTPQHAN